MCLPSSARGTTTRSARCGLLAKSRTPSRLAAEAYSLYEKFRPAVPAGTRGWGAKGTLELEAIRQLAR